ncbi:hypothetical protein KC19_12G155300 [Ceratodon purpureus]|uniref:Uncharacterized protein n=1 Tax=Ceratodon purpureus TaxID=3225 RepID=A0A8T0GA57_CERPU|nr:hypothetical protein KC19_12G155300 [Ceratodon purpureus]
MSPQKVQIAHTNFCHFTVSSVQRKRIISLLSSTLGQDWSNVLVARTTINLDDTRRSNKAC